MGQDFLLSLSLVQSRDDGFHHYLPLPQSRLDFYSIVLLFFYDQYWQSPEL